MIRTFRYPLQPTAAQETVLLGWLEQCCDLYNAALQERRDAWRKRQVTVGLYDQYKGLTDWRRSDDESAVVPAWVQRSALVRIDRAFKAFFRRCKAGQAPGPPRFRSRRRYDSFSVPGASVAIAGTRLTLPRLAGLKVHLYRTVP